MLSSSENIHTPPSWKVTGGVGDLIKHLFRQAQVLTKISLLRNEMLAAPVPDSIS